MLTLNLYGLKFNFESTKFQFAENVIKKSSKINVHKFNLERLFSSCEKRKDFSYKENVDPFLLKTQLESNLEQNKHWIQFWSKCSPYQPHPQ